jgi:peroxiredoxin
MIAPQRYRSGTYELGPILYTPAPAFKVRDHGDKPQSIETLMGERGLLLGFIGDIWLSTNIRRIIWLQRHAHAFIKGGINVALLVCDQPHTLYGFYVSSPTPPEFPLLADVDAAVHRTYNLVQYPGMVLLDRKTIIRHKWLMPDERVWPKIQEMTDIISRL